MLDCPTNLHSFSATPLNDDVNSSATLEAPVVVTDITVNRPTSLYFLLLNCGHESVLVSAKYHFVNPGGEELPAGLIPLPVATAVFSGMPPFSRVFCNCFGHTPATMPIKLRRAVVMRWTLRHFLHGVCKTTSATFFVFSGRFTRARTCCRIARARLARSTALRFYDDLR